MKGEYAKYQAKLFRRPGDQSSNSHKPSVFSNDSCILLVLYLHMHQRKVLYLLHLNLGSHNRFMNVITISLSINMQYVVKV